MDFNSVADLTKHFVSGSFEELPKSFTVDGMTYNYIGMNATNFGDVIKGHLGYAIFHDENSQNGLIFIWGTDKLRILPQSVQEISLEQIKTLSNKLKESVSLDDKNNSRDIVDDITDVHLIGFNDNKPIEARVDTGATQCSLHGENVKWSKDNDLVQFTFEGKRYQMNLVGEQKISSSDGGETERPVVVFRVKIAGKFFDGIAFNINDRASMPHQILIGQNLLEQGNFLVDPNGTDEDAESVTDSDDKAEGQKEAFTIELDDYITLLDEMFGKTIAEEQPEQVYTRDQILEHFRND